MGLGTTLDMLQCPSCGQGLAEQDGSSVKCCGCGSSYPFNADGYIEFFATDENLKFSESYVEVQRKACAGRYPYLKTNVLNRKGAPRVLDVGCGLGIEVLSMISDGVDAYGVDNCPYSPFWKQINAPAERFFKASALSLPFRDNTFDIAVSMGVIEHIGAIQGNVILDSDYREKRREYASSLLRVVKKGGCVLITCPNKSFPIDVQHGPSSPLSKALNKLTGLNIHRVAGKNHLLSYGEIQNLFVRQCGASRMTALPLSGFFGFISLENKSGAVKSLLKNYVEHLPVSLRKTGLNPYVIALIEK